ncbi:MAG: LamB/YcsF family protein [Altibacter sp.]|uniref:LamB/YcsF family protein n=1 Tax=Altibacter sp. TaxID=2024823 RepID=UPI001E00D58E|nr:LamB/YcsF family protein [Altibacter sp.]MBZ0328212.1 LamB/YcsF family protein [Altibacter sp.]
MIKSIDINADLGEGAGLDAKIMPLISSCSIACGGHFGDSESMLETLLLAKKHQVKVGAHPSFPDRDNFGRKVITLTKRELTDTVFHQLLHFFAICETEDIPVHHIKLHGALYNYAAIDAPTADAVVEAIVATKIRPKLYVPYHSILAKKAENLLPLVYEAFIDRRYTDALSLVPRTDKNAVIDAAELAWNQLYEIIHTGYVTTISGEKRELIASTFCIHGDHENSVEILKYIRKQLNLHQILVS